MVISTKTQASCGIRYAEHNKTWCTYQNKSNRSKGAWNPIGLMGSLCVSNTSTSSWVKSADWNATIGHLIAVNTLTPTNFVRSAFSSQHDVVTTDPMNMKNNKYHQGPVSIRKTILPGMAIPMLKIRRPNGRLIFNMGITIPSKTVFLIETAPWFLT